MQGGKKVGEEHSPVKPQGLLIRIFKAMTNSPVGGQWVIRSANVRAEPNLTRKRAFKESVRNRVAVRRKTRPTRVGYASFGNGLLRRTRQKEDPRD